MGQTTPFRAGAGSSCLNGPLPGSSYGGYTTGFPGSGTVQFRCLVPSKLADNSAGSETIMACQCVKAIVAMRMLTEELGLKQHAPTPMSLDAKAVIDGTTNFGCSLFRDFFFEISALFRGFFSRKFREISPLSQRNNERNLAPSRRN